MDIYEIFNELRYHHEDEVVEFKKAENNFDFDDFGTGTLNGNVLTFTCTTSGQLAYQGVMYPYYSNAQMTCIRQ